MGPVVDMSKLPRLFYMHPIIIWSVCVLFLSSHRTIKAGNYFSTLPRLLLAASLTRDYIYPHKNCTVDQCATYPGTPMHINRIKECALLLLFLDVLEVTSTTTFLYEQNVRLQR